MLYLTDLNCSTYIYPNFLQHLQIMNKSYILFSRPNKMRLIHVNNKNQWGYSFCLFHREKITLFFKNNYFKLQKYGVFESDVDTNDMEIIVNHFDWIKLTIFIGKIMKNIEVRCYFEQTTFLLFRTIILLPSSFTPIIWWLFAMFILSVTKMVLTHSILLSEEIYCKFNWK